MSSWNLNDLMAELETSAGFEKVASVKEVAEDKPAVSTELESILTKRASKDLTNEAFAEGEALAKELLTKLASDIQLENGIMQAEDEKKVVPVSGGTVNDVLTETIEEGLERGAESDDKVDSAMDKQSQFMENKTMAQSIMQKLAQMVGEPTTTPAAGVNLAGAPVPNQIQMGNAEMTAFDDAKVQPLPGAEGTINNILEAIVAGAKAQGGGSDNLVDGQGPAEGVVALGSKEDMQEKAAAVSALVGEGMDFDSAVNMVKEAEFALQAEADEMEKIAAVQALTAEGVSFEDAVELVKQAEYEIAADEADMEKKAAFEYLVSNGVDFDEAAKMVKQAGPENINKGEANPSKFNEFINKTKGKFRGGAKDIGSQLSGLGVKGQRWNSLKQVAKNPVAQAALAGGALLGAGATAALRKREKTAAFEALTANGVSFDDAVELVKQAELEVYGE